jgi:colanic acid biosynthesis glycosyl transferase WcaI
MRIVLLNQYYAPDAAATAQIAADLGAELVRAGHDVHAICCDRSYGQPKRRYSRRETIDGVQIDRVRSTAFGRGSSIGRLTDYATFLSGAARRLLFGPRPDVVVALTTPPMVAYVPLMLRRYRGFKVVFWSMDVYPEVAFKLGALKRGSLFGRLFAALSHRILGESDVTVALGETMAARLHELGARKVEVVHNWADEKAIIPRPALGHPSRTEWGWMKRFVVLYSGNLGLAHEFDTLIAAAGKLAETMPNVLFAFAGVGPRLREVREGTLHLPNIEFHDFVERSRLGESLTAGDVHLVTLRSDLAGLLVPSKIYGILAAGRPTIYIGPAVGEVHDILRDGKCGVSIRNGDVDGVVAAIHDYASDPSRRNREGGNARRLLEQRFTKQGRLIALREIIERTAVPTASV